jgi:hypothetical protein
MVNTLMTFVFEITVSQALAPLAELPPNNTFFTGFAHFRVKDMDLFDITLQTALRANLARPFATLMSYHSPVSIDVTTTATVA